MGRGKAEIIFPWIVFNITKEKKIRTMFPPYIEKHWIAGVVEITLKDGEKLHFLTKPHGSCLIITGFCFMSKEINS